MMAWVLVLGTLNLGLEAAVKDTLDLVPHHVGGARGMQALVNALRWCEGVWLRDSRPQTHLLCVVVDERRSLLVVLLKARLEHFHVVVGSLDQWLAGDIILASNLHGQE